MEKSNHSYGGGGGDYSMGLSTGGGGDYSMGKSTGGGGGDYSMGKSTGGGGGGGYSMDKSTCGGGGGDYSMGKSTGGGGGGDYSMGKSTGGGGDYSMGRSTGGGGGGGGTNSNSTNNNRDSYLNHLHKIANKITKPNMKRPSSSLINDTQNHSYQIPPPLLQSGGGAVSGVQLQAQPPPQQQPPVYNVNKNDFRDVVQRLTGSPAHDRFPAPPPPIQQPKPTSSRLQRIRPPPLAQISNRPPGLPQIGGNLSGNVVNSIPAMNPAGNAVGVGSSGNTFYGGQRQPLSPLPPFPTVHAAAESPISSYMRYLQNVISSPAASPRWNNVLPPPQPQPQPLAPPLQQQNIPPSEPLSPYPTLPPSPLPFGCIPSPRSPYLPPLSPSFHMSPSGQLGFPQLPMSPTVPLPSPNWRDM